MKKKCNIHRYTELIYDNLYGRFVCPLCLKEENSFNERTWSRRMERDGMKEVEDQIYDPED